jgi:hypothetical protein
MGMEPVRLSFIISRLREEEVEALKNGQVVISKMFLTNEDYKLFRYKEGSCIQVESVHGNRIWCTITNLEILSIHDKKILIFTLVQAPLNHVPPS